MPTVDLPGNAIDQHRFGLHRQAEVVGQAGDLAVLHAGIRLELVGRDDRSRMNLRRPRLRPRTRGTSLRAAARLPSARARRSCVRPSGASSSACGGKRVGAALALGRQFLGIGQRQCRRGRRRRASDRRRGSGARRRRFECGRGCADHRGRFGRLGRRRLRRLGRRPLRQLLRRHFGGAAAAAVRISARPSAADRDASSALPAAGDRAVALRAASRHRRSTALIWSRAMSATAAKSRPNENCVARITARNSRVRIRMIEPVRFEIVGQQRRRARRRRSRRRGSPCRPRADCRRSARGTTDTQQKSSPAPTTLV